MSAKPSVLAVILARSGSKGLPGKNILPLLGHPLIAYTLAPVRHCKNVDRILVSTDDEEIANVARRYGAETPFIRPKAIAEDFTRSETAVKHALEWLRDNENYRPDVLVYLQLTDLFKDPLQIDLCVETLWKRPELDSVFLAFPDKKNYWKETETGFACLTPGNHVSRQLKRPVFREDTGLGCATRPSLLLEREIRLGETVQIIPNDQLLIDIHTEFDFWLAEKLLRDRPEYARHQLQNYL